MTLTILISLAFFAIVGLLVATLALDISDALNVQADTINSLIEQAGQ